jgi:hypothetical protein
MQNISPCNEMLLLACERNEKGVMKKKHSFFITLLEAHLSRMNGQ